MGRTVIMAIIMAGLCEALPAAPAQTTATATPVAGARALRVPPLAQLASLEGRGWRETSRAAGVSSGADSLGTKVSVSVRRQSVIRGDKVLLGDVAAISGGNEETRRRVAGTGLAAAPAIGRGLRLTAAMIEAALGRERVNGGEIHLFVPGDATAMREEQALRRAEIVACVTSAAQQLVACEPQDLMLSEWTLPSEIRVPSGKVEMRADLRRRDKMVGTQSFDVVVSVDGRETQRVRGAVFVDAMANVVQAVAPIARDEAITTRQIGVVRMRLSELPTRAIQEPGAAVGKVCARAIRPGDLLRGELIRPQTLVKRNDVVVMEINGPRLRAQTRGVAQGQGTKGDLIPVINPASGKQVLARVVGERKVEVER